MSYVLGNRVQHTLAAPGKHEETEALKFRENHGRERTVLTGHLLGVSSAHLVEKRRNGFCNQRKCFRMNGTDCGRVAQLGERVLCKHEVAGSIPVTSTKLLTDCIEPSSFVSAVNSTFRLPRNEPRPRQIDHLSQRLFFR